MIVTELYDGQGLGNQLWCYVVTRVIAEDKGYAFGIKSPQKWKGADFMPLDFGLPVAGGTGPEGGPAATLPEGTTQYYRERELRHPTSGKDVRTHDALLAAITDNTKIDGVMQDEQYIAHRKNEIREWLRISPEHTCLEYASDAICIINFRGGEYIGSPDLFLPEQYWKDAVAHMRTINPAFRFVVITDDPKTAQHYFPDFEVFHFSIAKDYAIINSAHYLILSNSSFPWFPAWLSTNLKYCVAPKYWAAYNTSDGYWSPGYAVTSGWNYLDRSGRISTYEASVAEISSGTLFSAPVRRAHRGLWLIWRNFERRVSKALRLLARTLK